MTAHLDAAADTGDRPAPLLEVEDLEVEYATAHGRRRSTAVRGVSFRIDPGEVVAIVGESGSGKSSTAHAIINLLPGNARLTAGRIRFAEAELSGLTAKEWEGVRGRSISLIPQDPTVSLDPLQQIGRQVAEVLRIHDLADRRTAQQEAIRLLDRAGVRPADERAQQYPHEFSGGMRQRALIAAALAANPRLVIADEPTSALDVTVQRQILDDLTERTRELGTAVLLITHDLGVAADRADRILVMRHGEIVEQGPAERVLVAPEHPYTRALIAAAPSLGAVLHLEDAAAKPDPGIEPAEIADEPILVACDLVREFPARTPGHRGEHFRAVDGVGFELRRGETLGIVGESGSGKSTTARLATRLDRPDGGQVHFAGTDITDLDERTLRPLRRRFQFVYQSPYASLNPRFTLEQIVAEPLQAFRVGSARDRRARTVELFDQVGLPQRLLGRRPAELSGGQRQRVAIARALALKPDVVVLDEAVSALDVSVQSQILDLLTELQREYRLGYLFISHDLAVIEQISARVLVLQGGRVVEQGATAQVLHHPAQEYTQQLVDAIPGRRVAEWAAA